MTDIQAIASQSANADLDNKFSEAKSFLMSASGVSGDNLYDHLAKVLNRLLTERPTNAVDIFEDVSRREKKEKFVNRVDTLIDKPDRSKEAKLAEIQRGLFIREGEEEEMIAEADDMETPLPNLQELCYYFEQAGVGLGREETFRIWLAMKSLVEKNSLESIRFWGKLFGIEENYYVAEVKFQSGLEEEDKEDDEEKGDENEAKEDAEENEEEDPIPKSNYKAPPTAPKEPFGVGANKYVYFVCNAPGKEWVRLPMVTPEQISVSRKIRKFLTGRLDAPIVSYPPFPGTEKNYLRAQIARISAGTHISPGGYYKFEEEGEAEGEEEEGRTAYVQNEEFDGLSARELVDPGYWVHHMQHILPQGRTRWWNPKQRGEEEEMEEDEEEEKEEPDEPEPEQGPPLLTPLSEDVEIDGQPAWAAKISSNLVSQFAIAVLRSNLWPGAYAFGVDKKFENVYIGWGQKYAIENLNPQIPPVPQEEFVSGPEITEAEDPTPQDEEEYRKAQEKAEEAEEEAEEEEEEEEAEAEDD